VGAYDAFDTLYTVLETLCRIAAPLLPLVTENIWQGLTGGRSVHLEDWPEADLFPADSSLVSSMDSVREITSTALALRKKEGLRVRLPLADLTVVSELAGSLFPFSDILRDELNVKQVRVVMLTDDSAVNYGITQKLSVNARAAGPRLGKQVQQIIQAAKAGDWSESGGVVTAGGVDLVEGEYELTLETGDSGESSQALALLPSGGFVLLNTETSAELEAEGFARDVIRAVQDTRKAAGFDVSDRIHLDVICFADSDAHSLRMETSADIAGDTLATDFVVHDTSFHPELAGIAETSPTEWLSAIVTHPAEHFAVIPAGQYANVGSFVVAVSRVNRVVNV
jgi:isoleucyl-tRNA synthetase